MIWSSDMINRSSTARRSPASCAAYFDRVARAVQEALFGVEGLDAKKEKLPDGFKPSIFGRAAQARACHAVTEAQARGALHLHILLWLRFGPLWYARWVHDPDQRKVLIEHLTARSRPRWRLTCMTGAQRHIRTSTQR